MSTSYFCNLCGETHEDLPLDIAFDKPGAYFQTPANQRNTAWKLDNDTCVFGGNRFFIRGCVFVPMQDIEEHFVWGLWAEVSKHAFERYQAVYEKDGTREMPCRGALSVEREARYSGMNGLLVDIQFSTADQRPHFRLSPSNHVLFRDQDDGITLHRVQEILHLIFPNKF